MQLDTRRINCLGSSYNDRPGVVYCRKEEEEKKSSEALETEEFSIGKISLNGPRLLYAPTSKGDE
jgi:hypothetical protein